jgi:outer membrane protein OmpA-like peptidoglycan-associated protein
MRGAHLLPAFLTVLCFGGLQAQPADTLTVHFASNESVLLPADRAALDHRIDPALRRIASVQLFGYCDSVGANGYNDSLSRQRVRAVKEYLVAKGIADTLFRLLQPYGKRRPLNDNGDEEKRSENRRVTIIWKLAGAPPSTVLREAIHDTANLVGKTIELNVIFYRDIHFPLPVSIPALQELLSVLREHPRMKIEIQGHVCCVPSDMDGFDILTKKSDLSIQRARYIYNFLAARGIDSTRLSYKGFGASHKIYPQELNDFQMTRNRRVEVKILAW